MSKDIVDRSNQYEDSLLNIRKILSSKNLSILIGAGFSKNVDRDLFPSWGQLLKDMIIFTNLSRLKEGFATFGGGVSFDKYCDEQIWTIIEEIGYLAIVSQYIKKKGYREAVELYIEEHTPRLHWSKPDGKPLLSYERHGKTLTKELSLKNLDLHRKLVRLPWTNIYTTNYDNLIESCVPESEVGLKNTITELKKKLNDLDAELSGQLEMLRKYEESDLEKEPQYVIDTLAEGPQKTGSEGSRKPKTFIDEGFNLKMTISHKEREIIRLKQKIFDLDFEVNECYTTVLNSLGLAVKRNRNIIKLHGSIRFGDEEPYGFDNDILKHYVISQEDFDTYPVKHEAFTQLMRISLLQGYFCLIGFSGDDPNFLSWIAWVRDIIRRDGSSNDVATDKVFLIDMVDKPVSRDKQQFYRNHSIVHIPLLHKDCIEFLTSETGSERRDTLGFNEVLNLFFEFLEANTPLSSPQIAVELIYKENYNLLTEKLFFRFPEEFLGERVTDLISVCSEMLTLKRYNRIASVSFSHDYARRTMISLAYRVSKDINVYEEYFPDLMKCIINSLNDMYVPFSILIDRSVFNKLLKFSKKINSTEVIKQFFKLDLQDAVWQNDQERIKRINKEIRKLSFNTDEDIEHLLSLSAAFNLDFAELTRILQSWIAIDARVLNKAGLQCLISTRDSLMTLHNYHPDTIQENLYAFELQNYIEQGNFESSPPKGLREKMNSIEKRGFKSISKTLDYLLESINERDEKIKPYGEGKFTVSKSRTFSNVQPELQAVQIFGILSEIGYPVSLNNINLKSTGKIYAAIKSMLNYYPYPALFYTLQYCDEKFIKRVAQDFSYSVHLTNDLKRIGNRLMASYKNESTPQYIRENILHFLTQLLFALDQEDWNGFISDMWKDKKIQLSLMNPDRLKSDEFIKTALLFTDSVELAQDVIISCITEAVSASEKKVDRIVDILYRLALNPLLKSKHEEIRIGIPNSIIDILLNSTLEMPGRFFIIGNIDALLTDSERVYICNQIRNVNLNSIDGDRIWGVLNYYAKDDDIAIQYLKSSILKDEHIWDAGFTNRGFSTMPKHTSWHEIRKLPWNLEELSLIFNRLVMALGKIIKFLKKRSDDEMFAFLLEDMFHFLVEKKTELFLLPKFSETIEFVNNLYNKQRGFDSISKGLISNISNYVNWATAELSWSVYYNKGLIENSDLVNLVMNRILLKNSEGLASCLTCISNWCYDFRERDEMKKFENILTKIVEEYQSYYSDKIDLPFWEEKIVKIAFVLDYWKLQSSAITHFKNLLYNSKFNNIRHTLRMQLDFNL